jgi:transposase
MFSLSGAVKIYYSSTPVDMRKSFNSLPGAVWQYINQAPLSGHWFVFFSKSRKLVKIIYWQDGGFCIWAKKLCRGCFNIPKSAEGKIELDSRELYAILSGIKPKRYYKRYKLSENH